VTDTRAYMVRGKIGTNCGNEVRVGQFTYLAETGDHFYIWNGIHKAARFESVKAGLDAAGRCNGPWFNVPDPATIESVECPLERGAPYAIRPAGTTRNE